MLEECAPFEVVLLEDREGERVSRTPPAVEETRPIRRHGVFESQHPPCEVKGVLVAPQVLVIEVRELVQVEREMKSERQTHAQVK
jgi:cell envelope opacity-associated protein A